MTTSRLPGLAKRDVRIFALIASAWGLGSFVPAALAQEPIRIQTNLVLVPVSVVDKERERILRNGSPKLWQAISEGNVQLQQDIVDGIMIRDLASSDFQVFEDGKEQTIQSVTHERGPYYDFHDNRGHHSEYFAEGGGKWSSRQWPPWLVGDFGGPHYLIAYAPPESPEGSCHQIRIAVNRRNALILARPEYCNTKHSPSDPLNGTDFDKRLERDLASAKRGNVDVSLMAIAFYTESNPAHVHIALDWPWRALKPASKMVAVLGIVLKKDETLSVRFSDFIKYNSTVEDSDGPHWDHIWTRYETQLSMPSGQYHIRVVLSDGTNFGRAEIPLTVDDYNRSELAISGVSLCKQVSDAYDYSPRHAPRLPGSWTTKPPGSYVALISDDIEFKPTGDTRFKRDETLYTYFEVYEPLLATEPSTTVDFRVRIVDVKTGEVRSDSPSVSATPYVKAGSPVIPIGRRTNISNLPKGSYRLDVQATDSAGKTTRWRSVDFTVE